MTRHDAVRLLAGAVSQVLAPKVVEARACRPDGKAEAVRRHSSTLVAARLSLLKHAFILLAGGWRVGPAPGGLTCTHGLAASQMRRWSCDHGSDSRLWETTAAEQCSGPAEGDW
jgi:hypothetical protein